MSPNLKARRYEHSALSTVMPGLVPGIHAFL
jgi:hypothetical protein